uniref:granulin b isoform X2 n=1 Tax=Pristiophorus japonicus TaxID=55135 RepID=UPI00398EE6B9
MLQTFVILWLATGLASTIQCPDGTTCSDEATCCKKAGGGYACCPEPMAVCCSDFKHCCPANTTCDLVHLTCVAGLSTVPWVEKIPSIQTRTAMWEEAKAAPLVQAGTPNALTENVCLDNAECPPEYTCMPTSQGFYGCCPLTEATVCKDYEHCCPKGYECDLIEAKCRRTGVREEELPLVTGVGNLRTAESELCGNMSCSVGYTCCTSKDFGWGCCPMKDAVCCDDDHCCPKDFKCDKARRTCVKLVDENVKAIICPDGASECPDGSTCCLLPNAQWGCCPLEKAVCCEDRLHCCPTETRCDLEQSKCVSQYGTMEMWKKFPAHRRFAVKNTKARNVPCNDTMACPDNDTCCKLASGQFGCCPLPNAVCCSDHIHCCPNGCTCDPVSGTCSPKGTSIPWKTKVPAIVTSTQRGVQCNDTVHCPTDYTCCKNVSGDWACCPVPQAVCCDDHIHCCPNGYTCDVESATCQTKDSSIPMVLKLTASVKKVEGKMSDVHCDDRTTCTTGNTCCRNGAGGWGCCPLPQAVCCEDHIHCCPAGYTCDLQSGSCAKNDALSTLLLKKSTVVKETLQGRLSRVLCDTFASCPANTTCCKMNSGLWMCCPLPQAVCCDDHIHCCPNGYTCDVQAGLCHKDNISIPLVTNMPTLVKSEALDMQCDDTVKCQSGATCCRTPSGQWACCPLPEAVCCEDHEHCCPNGYTCNVGAGTCERQSLAIPWEVKQPLSDVKCDDTFRCPSPATCCKLASGSWACCPYEHATCCEDQLHCCPNGYTCNGAAKACTIRPQLSWDLFFSKHRKAFNPL